MHAVITRGTAEAGATFDETGAFRYSLWRRWEIGPALLFVMLNPSTADENILDPTVRRCVGYAKAWGFPALEVVNIFALRSTDPAALYTHDDPTGDPENLQSIAGAVYRSGLVVCAWGTHGELHGRGRWIRDVIVDNERVPHALKTTKEGHPCHPLYLAKTLIPRPL